MTTMQTSTLKSINPSNGQVVGEVSITPPEEIPHVVARARAALSGWSELTIAQRAELLSKAGPKLRQRAEELGRLTTLEMGKPLKEGIGEAHACVDDFEDEISEIARALEPQVMETDDVRTTIYRDPFGVAACISPWNFPILMPHQQIVPALVAGNTVVYKPSEQTPLVGQAYAQTIAECLPENVLQIVHGADQQGKTLVAADVDLIVFTGSREAGKHILAEASKGLKRVILELGGKDPLIVLDDADIQAAASFAARNSFRNAGQVCVSTERIYVEDAAHDAFVSALRAETEKLIVGDGMDETSTVGPMVSERQRDHVIRQIADAISRGATVAIGNHDPDGNFLSPTILTAVNHEMDIARDETFGPVACVVRVSNDDEAVALANDSPYGLGAVVFGEPARAERLARRLQAGMIGVNQGLRSAPGAPWVGARQSGYGFHSGPEGHRQFAQVRVVSTPK